MFNYENPAYAAGSTVAKENYKVRKQKTVWARFAEKWKWTLWTRYAIILTGTIFIYAFFFIIFPEHLFEIHFRIKNAYLLILLDLVTLSGSGLLIWELNSMFLKYLDRKLPWEKRPFLRFLIQIKGTSALAYLLLASGMIINASLSVKVCPELGQILCKMNDNMLEERIFVFFLGSLFIFHGAYFSGFFYRRWAASLLEAERMKRENIHAQLHTLQNLVNPHFVFNGLNTLTSIIEEDQRAAVEYVQRLANFYRYLLQRQTEHLAALNDELKFVESYIYLQKKRFGENMIVEFKIDESARGRYLPTYTLQILLENAIKHNIISSELPLTITVYSVGANTLVVENNLQKRSSVSPSTEHGLANIRNRYQILSGKDVAVEEHGGKFKVTIPLFDEQEQDEYSYN